MSFFNYSSTLFSGMSGGNKTSFSGLLGEYNQIRNGTYGRLLKAYYKKFNMDGTEKSSSKDTNKTDKVKTGSDSLDTAKELNAAADAATKLQTAATKLAAVKEGSGSLYEKKTLVETKEDGTTSTRTDYDYDTLVKTVQGFVSDYNNTLEAVSTIETASVTQKTQWMTQLTKQYEDELSEIGITVDKDGRLELDEKAFRGKEMAQIQDFFEGTDSFVGKLARKASGLAGAAELQATKTASAYTAGGNNYAAGSMNSGTLFDSLF